LPCPSRLVAYVQSNTQAKTISSHPWRLMVVSDGHPMPRSPLVCGSHLSPRFTSRLCGHPSQPELGVLLPTPASVTTVAMCTLVGWM